MNKFFPAAVVSCVLVFGACSVGPDYQRPELAVPEEWASAEKPAEPLPQSELAEWWKRFNDPVLDALIAEAVKNNLDLKQAAARVREARATRRISGSAFFPSIDASAAYQRQRNPGKGSGVAQTSPSGVVSAGGEQDLFEAGFDAAWELDVFGGVRRDYEAAAAGEQAAIEDERDVLVTLLSETATAYLTLRGRQAELAILRRNLELQTETLGLTQRRFDSGFAAALDVANAKAEVERTTADIPLTEIAVQQSIFSLAVLLGRAPAAMAAELKEEKPFPETPGVIPPGLPSELLERRPDVRRAEAELHQATANIGVATSDLFPKFNLTGAIDITGDSLSSLNEWDNRVWRIGPSIFWPVFDAGAIRANIDVQDARTEQALAAYEKTVLTALQDVESALVTFNKQTDRQTALAKSVESNRKAYDLSTQLYREGLSDFLSVLTSERSLLVAEVAEMQSKREQAISLISFYKALGGGWVENSE